MWLGKVFPLGLSAREVLYFEGDSKSSSNKYAFTQENDFKPVFHKGLGSGLRKKIVALLENTQTNQPFILRNRYGQSNLDLIYQNKTLMISGKPLSQASDADLLNAFYLISPFMDAKQTTDVYQKIFNWQNDLKILNPFLDHSKAIHESIGQAMKNQDELLTMWRAAEEKAAELMIQVNRMDIPDLEKKYIESILPTKLFFMTIVMMVNQSPTFDQKINRQPLSVVSYQNIAQLPLDLQLKTASETFFDQKNPLTYCFPASILLVTQLKSLGLQALINFPLDYADQSGFFTHDRFMSHVYVEIPISKNFSLQMDATKIYIEKPQNILKETQIVLKSIEPFKKRSQTMTLFQAQVSYTAQLIHAYLEKVDYQISKAHMQKILVYAENVLHLDPSNAQMLAHLASLNFRLGSLDKGKYYFDILFKNNPDSTHYYHMLAHQIYTTGDDTESQDSEQFLAIDQKLEFVQLLTNFPQTEILFRSGDDGLIANLFMIAAQKLIHLYKTNRKKDLKKDYAHLRDWSKVILKNYPGVIAKPENHPSYQTLINILNWIEGQL